MSCKVPPIEGVVSFGSFSLDGQRKEQCMTPHIQEGMKYRKTMLSIDNIICYYNEISPRQGCAGFSPSGPER